MVPKFKNEQGEALYEFPESGYVARYQRAPYIEDGWYLLLREDGQVEHWEIAQYGGHEWLEGTYPSLELAWALAPYVCT